MRRSQYDKDPAMKISKGMTSFGVSRGVSPGLEQSKGLISTGVSRGRSIGNEASKGVTFAARRAKGGPLGYLGIGDPAGLERLKLSQERNKELNTPHYKKGGQPKKKWVKKAFENNKGALHKALHVPQGKKIPLSKIHKAEHSSNPKLRKEANLAETSRGFHHRSSRGR